MTTDGPGAEDRAGQGAAPPRADAAAGDRDASTQEQAAPPPNAPFAAQYGLIRPLQGRYLAGVGAALGRATRTDPVLWRVVLAVLVCFGGIGALAYLLLWLVTPEEGDTGSPAEALLGRGTSNTSPVLTGLLGLGAVGLLAFVAGRPFYLVLLGGALFLSVVMLANRSRTGPPPPTSQPASPQPSDPPAPPGYPAPGYPAPPAPAPAAGPPPGAVPAGPPAGAVPAGPPPGAVPVPEFPAPGAGYEPPGYRPPFAPHGPFAGASARTPWSYDSGPPPAPPPPPQPRERSALGPVTFFATLLTVGLVGTLDLAGVVNLPTAGYIAIALAVIGGGLLIGTWLGRARPLIAVGALLALALPVVHATETWQPPDHTFGEYSWTPETTDELLDEYHLAFGEGRLDLRQLDLAGEEAEITIHVTFGSMQVIVPAEPALRATSDTRFGNITVLGTSYSGGPSDRPRVVEDPGSGDPADGGLVLNLQVRFGDMEVYQ